MFRKSISVGRLFGIELKLDTSWLFVLALVLFSLTSLFSRWHPLWTTGTALAVAVVAAAAFFASVVLHELAHSVVARFVYKIPVRDITLHMFGGVASIEREPATPGAELFIAIVGPITSLALGAGMLVGGAYLTGVAGAGASMTDPADAVAQLGPTTTLLMWLGPVNIAIGLFNLIPGFPLDGGRILRAILWKATGDVGKATRWAATVGQGVGWSFIVAGGAMVLGMRVPFFGTGFGSGLWLAFIGMFLRGVAAQQEAHAVLREAMAGIRVADVMRAYLGWSRPIDASAVAHVKPSDMLADALPAFARSAEHQVPVVEDGILVGTLHEEDVVRCLEKLNGAPPNGARPSHAQ